jgi:phosphoribosylamine--glycine ligase
VPLAPAQDFKRVGDGDDGPNTGGMGAYSPVPFAGDDLVGDVMDRFVEPTLFRLRKLGIDYRGTLYAGLVLTAEGPKLLEYNVRFGDPEAQVVLPRLTDDLTDLLGRAADGDLRADAAFVPGAAVGVVAATPGYPDAPRTGEPIDGAGALDAEPDVDVYWAGVGQDDGGRLVTAGGRVCTVVGHGPTLADARRRAYAGIEAISFPDMHYRRDIARDAVEAESNTIEEVPSR